MQERHIRPGDGLVWFGLFGLACLEANGFLATDLKLTDCVVLDDPSLMSTCFTLYRVTFATVVTLMLQPV
jgi:hypothetical protein